MSSILYLVLDARVVVRDSQFFESRAQGVRQLGLKRIPYDLFDEHAGVDVRQNTTPSRSEGRVGRVVLPKQESKLAFVFVR